MNCPQCSAPIRVAAGFCGSCGTKLVAAPQESAPARAAPSVSSLPPLPPQPLVHQQQPAQPHPGVTLPPQPPVQSLPPDQFEQSAQFQQPVRPDYAPPPTFAPTVPSASMADSAPPSQPVASQPAPPGMISPPPGLIVPPPGMTLPATPVADTPVDESPSRALSDVVFVPAPKFPFISPPSPNMPVEDVQAEDLDATRVADRRPAKSPWSLHLPDGSKIPVNGAILIGRNPASNDLWPNAKLLPVVDKTKSVSKTHAVIEADAEGLWVTDLKSTNGVVVTHVDGRELEAQGNQRLSVDSGCGIELGTFIIHTEKD